MSKIMPSTLWNVIGRHVRSIQPCAYLRLFSTSCINHTTKAEFAKIKADPEKYKRQKFLSAIWKRNRYKNDPKYLEKCLLANRLNQAKLRETSETHRRYSAMSRWARRHTWFREQLPWRSHLPVVFSKRMEHSCASCGTSRLDGTRLWWKSLGSESYTCHACE